MAENQTVERVEMSTNTKLVLIFVFVTYVLCKLHAPIKPLVILQKPHYTLLGPSNSTEYEIVDVYDQLIDLKNFKFRLNSQTCAGTEAGLLLVMIISSAPEHFARRAFIRRAWGQTNDFTKVVFLMGESEYSYITQIVEHESFMNHDIVLGNFIDTYRNLTYKHAMGLKWVVHHCAWARYVLKTDDDLVINSKALRKYLVRDLSPWGANGLITCHVLMNNPVQRNSTSKWMVLEEEFAGRTYPSYCAGYAILYSQDVVRKLLTQVQTLSYFWIDDVHVTGTAAEILKIYRTPLQSLILSYNEAMRLAKSGTQLKRFLVSAPQLKLRHIKRIWKAISL